MPDPAASPDATSEEGATPGGETTTEPAAPSSEGDGLGPSGRRAIAELRKELRTAQKERDDLRAAEAARADAERTELEKATTRAEAAERRVADLEHETLARTAAVEAGIAQHWNRLKGDTADELAADAKALAESFGGGGPQPPAVADLGAGPRPPGPATGSQGFSERIRRQARR